MHEYDEAQKMLDTAKEIEPHLPWQRVNQGLLFALTGKRNEAEKILENVMKDKNEFVRLFGRLNIQTALGNLDEAGAALERMAEIHYWDWGLLYQPWLAGLRADPRFMDFRKKVGLAD